ncbi:MAG: chemotaxis protein CheD [Desulfobacterales bacterium]|nr:chemotaxis protein CheD [Desulfobacterales bacterium]
MKSNTEKAVTKEYFLKPGYIIVPDQPTIISTVLGSSVAVSLYDKRRKKGGMNHFLYPFVEIPQKATAQYGNVAIPTLIKMMGVAGVPVSDLEAQVFGGAFDHTSCEKNIGKENLVAATQQLARHRIKVVSRDIGGELGRKIVFNTHTCEILVLRVDRLRRSDWFPYHEDR